MAPGGVRLAAPPGKNKLMGVVVGVLTCVVILLVIVVVVLALKSQGAK